MSTTNPTNTTITEKSARSLGPAATIAITLVTTLAIVALVALAVVLIIDAEATNNNTHEALSIVLIVIASALTILYRGITIVKPGTTKVVTFFGNYTGTLRTTGLQYINPLSSRNKVDVRIRNFETKKAKVNDLEGNPIEIGAIIVWQVDDTAKASFRVDNFAKFIETQSEAAVRHIATQYPYDSPDNNTRCLRRATDTISEELVHELSERIKDAGLHIIEGRISTLAYAPEIASAMLQRQQAQAIVDARQTIVDGAVGMVERSLELLEERDIVDLDPERKAAMVSNLLVVLCSDGQTQPVINTGSLYS